MFKKLFALLITVSMVLTMTYIPAVAEDFAYSDILPDGWMGVEADACRIGEKTYKTLADAIGAAEDGDVISLFRDVEEEGPFEIIGGSVTIDGGGYTINCKEGFVVSGGSLTLKAGLTVVASESAALYVVGGEVNTSANLKSMGESAAIEAAPECTGAVTINGGNIEAEAEHCISWGESGTLLINEGVVLSSNPDDAYSKYCLPGYKLELNEEGKYQVGEILVCQIGEVGYQTFADALAAAENGDAVTLLMDINENGPFEITDVSVTVDGNGYTINCTNGFVVSGGSLTLKAGLTVVASESAALYVIGGEVNTSANLKSSGESAAIEAAPECTGAVTVDGGSIESAVVWGESGTLVITGGVFSVKPDDKYCLPGYHFELNGDDKYEVTPIFVATDDEGNTYNDLQTALGDIYDAGGGKISLSKNLLGEGIVNLLPGVTLDLNGYTLETEYITVYNGGFLVDSSAANSGLLKCAKGNAVIMTKVTMQDGAMSSGNNVLVWDAEKQGYIFTDYAFAGTKLELVTDGDVEKLNYTFAFFTEAHARSLFSSSSNDVSVIVRISWTKTDGNGNVTQYYEDVHFSDALVGAVVEANSGRALSVVVSGYEGLENLAFQSMVVSGTNMVTCTAPVAASAQ